MVQVNFCGRVKEIRSEHDGNRYQALCFEKLERVMNFMLFWHCVSYLRKREKILRKSLLKEVEYEKM